MRNTYLLRATAALWLCFPLIACGDDATTTGSTGDVTADTAGAPDGAVNDTGPEDTSTAPEVTAQCTTAADCTSSTGGACVSVDCVSGQCTEVAADDGTSCDDGDTCTDNDVCTAGVCAGTANACDDGDTCTTDACDPATGCTHTMTPGAPCDDGSACTENDICSSAGTCLGIPKQCSGGSGCLVGECNDATGDCETVPDVGASCDDGDVCTVLDACDDLGECAGSALPCDDGVDCTVDACDPATGTCAFTVDEAECDDGNPCTTASCDDTQGCQYEAIAGCCNDDDGCYDGDACTTDSCDLGSNTCSFPDNGTCCGSDTDCLAGEVCVEGDCLPEGDPATDYGFPRPGSWVSNLDLGGVEGVAECCFDFDGDGSVDNAVGDLTEAISGLVGQDGVNNALDEVLLDGTVNLVFAYPNGTPAGLPDVTTLTVEAFQGDAEGSPTFADKLNGSATFTAPLDNFLPGTSLAVGSFGDGTIAGGALSAGPGKLYEVPLNVLYFDFSKAELEQARIEGDMSAQGPGMAVANGKLGGVLPLASVYEAVNAFVADNCQCLNLTEPMIAATSESTGTCTTADPADVTCGDLGTDYVCATLNQFCNVALFIVNPDYDLDGNGVNDSLSLGVWFDASGTAINGLTP